VEHIRVLPIQLVNKIAAGEVVERPASVVKELIENAIDAEPTRIEVRITDGGKKVIAVSDDGTGMSQEDLALAFAPHATSKLGDEEDLFAISTMGFRGEALASIASISHAHIRTRRRSEDSGYEVTASGGTIEQVRPCPAPPGTTVTIRDLFFNTPARRKFLRTTNTELAHIAEQITRLSIPHPHIAVTLTHNERKVQDLQGAQTTRQRIGDILGAELSESLIPIAPRRPRRSGTYGAPKIAGLIGPPSAARSSGKWQYFFLNGRYIRDRLLTHALREAYRGLIEPGRFPLAFIFIELDPEGVDLNVHPTKIEVRFREPQSVHGELLAALKDTLNTADLTAPATFDRGTYDPEPSTEDRPAAQEHRESLRKALADFFKSTPPVQPRFSFPERRDEPPHAPRREERTYSPVQSPPGEPQTHRATHTDPTYPSPASTAVRAHRRAVQIHNSYLVVECEDGLEIVDQHALHERLIYNDLKRRLTEMEGSSGLTAQRMLIPETMKVTAVEAAALEANADLLGRLGIEVAAFGPGVAAVQQFPSLLAERSIPPGQFVREILDLLIADEQLEPERVLENLLEMMACKAAVKAGDPLSPEEIDSLLERRVRAEKQSACPHGRPTSLKLTLRDLERQFKRT